MRIALQFEAQRPLLLPDPHPQHQLAAWAYAMIRRGNPTLAAWLHHEGIRNGHERYKMFTFSSLTQSMDAAGPPTARLLLAFYLPELGGAFLAGLRQKGGLVLGQGRQQVELALVSSRILPEPELQTVTDYCLLSPVVIKRGYSQGGKNHFEYLGPESPGYGERLIDNLVRKYVALANGGHPLPSPLELADQEAGFALQGKAQATWVQLKKAQGQATRLKGFRYRFRLVAPVALQRIGLLAGFGACNPLGFGAAVTAGEWEELASPEAEASDEEFENWWLEPSRQSASRARERALRVVGGG